MRHQPVVVHGRIKLKDFAADYTAGRKKKPTRRAASELAKRIADLQKLFHANGSFALLLVFQGLDASGKDGAIRRVLRKVTPAGVQVAYFQVPTRDEAAHDYLWRVHRRVPARGMIGVFNRSHYEAVLAERFEKKLPHDVVRERYRQIVDFERMLVDNGTIVLKFYLHLSREEQGKRFRERLERPDKKWKFQLGDLEVRRRWREYVGAYEEILNETSHRGARWHIVPADHKWYRDLVVARTVVKTLEALKLEWPKPKEDLSKVKV